jgi:hypothetical protein
MHEHGSLPQARQDGLIEEAVGEELLLYDQDSHTAHCLSSIAACVWRHCDGEHDLAELAVLAGVSEDLVASTLYELCEKDLLDAEPELTENTVPGESRREAIARVARYGAAATAGSMVVSATAATPAMAESEKVIVVCCECLKVTNTPCACTEIKSKGEPADKIKCEEFCKGEVNVCKNLEASIVKGRTCQPASNKCV